jgi:hypothetical protein
VQKLSSGNPGLFSINITTGTNTQLNTDFTGFNADNGLNAMGFNVLDNYLYAYSFTGQIVRINSTKATVVNTLVGGNYVQTYSSGDIDTNGNFWILNSNGTRWAQIDLKPGSSTYATVLNAGATSWPSGYRSIDWSYMPSQGNYMYAVLYDITGTATTAKNIFGRWSLSTHTWEQIGTFNNLLGMYGASYASNSGTMWVSDNGGGSIWRIDVPSRSQPVRQSSGPASSGNDGARCVYASA